MKNCWRCWVLIVAAFVASLSPLRAREVLSCRFESGLVWVQVDTAVGGLSFLLDSGAGCSVLDSARARLLGLRSAGSEVVAGVSADSVAERLNGFRGRVGTVPAPASVLGLDLTALSRTVGQRVDGILGLDFFRGRAVEIDCGARRLVVGAGGGGVVVASQALSAPLVPVNDGVCVEALINGQRALLRVDTGCATALEWMPRASRSTLASNAALGVAPRNQARRDVRLQLGGAVFDRVSSVIHQRGGFSRENGLLGNGLLSRFVVTIDLPAKRLVLSPARGR